MHEFTYMLQETQFHSGSKTKTHSVILAKFEKGAIKKGSSDSSWEDHSIVVPALPPSELLSCAIIDVAYKLEVNAAVA